MESLFIQHQSVPAHSVVVFALGITNSVNSSKSADMSLKVFFVICVIGVVSAGHIKQVDFHEPLPYRFGYDIKDLEGSQHRHESGDGHGSVQGSYGYVDNKGIQREVQYVADHQGFRAQIKTNEPGTANQDPAHVKIHSTASHVYHQVPVHEHHQKIHHY